MYVYEVHSELGNLSADIKRDINSGFGEQKSWRDKPPRMGTSDKEAEADRKAFQILDVVRYESSVHASTHIQYLKVVSWQLCFTLGYIGGPLEIVFGWTFSRVTADERLVWKACIKLWFPQCKLLANTEMMAKLYMK